MKDQEARKEAARLRVDQGYLETAHGNLEKKFNALLKYLDLDILEQPRQPRSFLVTKKAKLMVK